jgi:hypothetical protein
MEVNNALIKKYTTKTSPVSNDPGCWNSTRVEILCNGEKVGEYIRQYPSLFNTFHPFLQDGKEFALYSADYTTTRVMSLPDCKDLCGEEGDTFGFCPTGFAVPYEPEKNEGKDPFNGQFGFVCGCIWGDDCSWKIEYLDLSGIQKGILKREDWLGYTEMIDDGDKLKDYIDLKWYDPADFCVTVLRAHHYRDKKPLDSDEEAVLRLSKMLVELEKKWDSRWTCLKRAFRIR